MMHAKLRILLVLGMVLSLVGALSTVGAQDDPIEIEWFVGLGAGGQPEQIDAQNEVVDAFNASQDEIELSITIVDNNVAYDTLGTLIASGNAPDIVGPVGNDGANAFAGNFLDIEPYLEDLDYDLSQFPESAVDSFRTEEGLIGLPFATFPSFIFFNRDLFDEAGAPYPPQAFGISYTDWNGEEREWNIETFTDLARYMTVDTEGFDATMDEFGEADIVQWGFVSQWNEPRGHASLFGPGILIDDEGNAQMPEVWREALNWYYDGIWVDGFIPNASQQGSDLLANGNPFTSGNVAMAHTHLWYTCCLDSDLVSNWDIAVVPAYEGNYTAKLHGDTFRVLDSTDNPEAAVEVMTYLIGEAAPELLQVYGGLPAREEQQEEFLASLDETFPQGVNWDVAVESLSYADSPSHEANLPNYSVARDRIGAYQTLYEGTPGLDVDAELDRLVSDLQAIYDAETEAEAAGILADQVPPEEQDIGEGSE